MIDKVIADVSSVDGMKSMTVGQCLQQAREAMQLSVEDVSNALHITPTYVNSIETNQFQKLPAAIFTRGYIKSYARLVNLSADEIITLYFRQTDDKPMESLMRPAVNEYGVSMRRHAIKWAVGFILIVLLLPTLGWWYAHQDSVETTATSSTETIIPVKESAALSATTEENSTAETAIITSTAADTTISVETKEESTPASTAIAENAKIVAGKLQIKFAEKSWVQVKDIDNVTLHDAEHHAGESITISGKPPLYVWIKNAKATNVLFNDDPVKIENQDNNGVARFVVGK